MAGTKVVEMTLADSTVVSWLDSAVVNISFSHVLVLATLLFVMGLFGTLFPRLFKKQWSDNPSHGFSGTTVLVKQMFSIQLMLLSIVLVFLFAGRYWQTADGQIVVIFLFVFAISQMLLGLVFSYILRQFDIKALVFPSEAYAHDEIESLLGETSANEHIERKLPKQKPQVSSTEKTQENSEVKDGKDA